MVNPQQRQYILVVLLIATVLIWSSYTWWQEPNSAPVPVTASAPELSAETRASTTEMVIYVSGYVVRPGVYKLSGELRTIDFVNAAGGFAPGANASGINLAQKLTDGMQIHVPGSLSPESSTGTVQATGKLSLNTADKRQLESLPGIGPALADRIIEYRTKHGGFKTLDELRKVSGIGEAKYKALKDNIVL